MSATASLLVWQGDPAAADVSVLDVLAERYGLEHDRARTVNRAYVDTPDLRLHRNGLGLVHDRVGRSAATTLRAIGAGETPPSAGAPDWPAFASALPAGLPAAFASAAWVRALLPVCEARVTVTTVRVLDDETKTVVRLDWEEPTVLRPARVRLPSRVLVRGVRGYDKHAARVTEQLVSLGFAPAADAEHVLALDAAGLLEPPDASPAITADQLAPVAVASALLAFLDAIEANVQGTVDDVDTEFLHDLRVAVRRTRSLLKLAGDVLPRGLAGRYAARFKWLGDLTTPNRDLDVYLLGYDAMVDRLVTAAPVDLDPFRAHLEKSRTTMRRGLVRGLTSQRFATLVERWRADLTAVVDAEQPADVPTVAALAAERIGLAHQGVVKRARRITPDSPPADVHDLRKRCKELRYLVEVFAPVHSAKASRRVIRDLKQVQDTLGAFQDGEVQRNALRTYADEMLAAGTATGACLLAMGELTTIFDARLRRARTDLDVQLPGYLGGRTRRHLLELAGGAS